MDPKVTAILDNYHALIVQEKEARQQLPHVREKETGPDTWMRAVGPQTGQLINIIAGSMRAPRILELGTSYGYSGIWLAEAARAAGGHLTTIEMHEYKSAFAREMSQKAGLAGHVDFLVGDAVQLIAELAGNFDFVLVDLWKDLYVPCLDAFYPKLNPGAVIVADNMLKPDSVEANQYRAAVKSKPGISSVMLTVGTGIEISRFQGE
ncbi:DUF1442 domain-containing protein [Herbaspirillum lusitanum]|uniref:DUF1442 domain-containing protein n=1 Tax=Herbaspirillum lusitanum TaxID=213312 RepID=A0ABW9AGW9_9BURK